MTPRRATPSIVAGAHWSWLALSATDTAHAQVQIDNVPEALIEAFRAHLDRWSGVILGFAKKVFLVLGSIELTVALARSYYQEGGTFDRVIAGPPRTNDVPRVLGDASFLGDARRSGT